jgi:hypothetical protein
MSSAVCLKTNAGMFFKKKGLTSKLAWSTGFFLLLYYTYCLVLIYTKNGLASKLAWSNGFSTGFLFTTLLHRRTGLFDFPALALDKSVLLVCC